MQVKRTLATKAQSKKSPAHPNPIELIIPQDIGFKASNGGWLDSEICDGTLEAFMRRMDDHERLLIHRGQFHRDDAARAVLHVDPATKEAPALWLRGQLKKLRKAERSPGTAPARRGLT